MNDPRAKPSVENPGIRRALIEAGLLRPMDLSVELAEGLDRIAVANQTTSEQLLNKIVSQYLDRRISN